MPNTDADKATFRLPSGDAFGITDTGSVRSTNEDSFMIDASLGLAIVADGMGGHAGGEMASQLAISQMHARLAASVADIIRMDDERTLLEPDATNPDVMPHAMTVLFDAMVQANQAIFTRNAQMGTPEGTGMGTTVTGLWHRTADSPLFVFSIGDSRVYRFRAGELVQLTHDDSLVQYMIDSGIPEAASNRNVLLKAMGPTADIEPSVLRYASQPSDLYLLCSDGLHGVVDDAAIASILREAATGDLQQVSRKLISQAITAGSRDNITAVLVALRG